MVLNFVLKTLRSGVTLHSVDGSGQPICSCHVWSYFNPYHRGYWDRCDRCLEDCIAHGSDLSRRYSLGSDIASKVISFFFLYWSFKEREGLFDGA